MLVNNRQIVRECNKVALPTSRSNYSSSVLAVQRHTLNRRCDDCVDTVSDAAADANVDFCIFTRRSFAHVMPLLETESFIVQRCTNLRLLFCHVRYCTVE